MILCTGEFIKLENSIWCIITFLVGRGTSWETMLCKRWPDLIFSCTVWGD